MDREEKLKYEQGIEEYFDNHKVYDLFEKLFKELILHKPENPINYLIEHLEKKQQKRIFITGVPTQIRKDLCSKISRELNYSYASTSDLIKNQLQSSSDSQKIKECFSKNLLVDDEVIIGLVRDQLIKFEENNESYIIEGFPKNRTQAIFLQSVGLLPDNVIIFDTSKENSEKYIKEKIIEKSEGRDDDEYFKSCASNSYNEALLCIHAVEDIFKGFCLEVNVDMFQNKDDIIKEVVRLLKFKEKSNAARMPPRVVLSGPPTMKKEKIGENLSKKLQIVHVSIRDLLNNEIKLQNENSIEILNSFKNNQLVSDKIILKLLEDRLHCSDCIINGWIITGFPLSEGQFNYVKNMKSSIKPSMLCYIDIDSQNIVDNLTKMRYDLNTGKHYKMDGNKYNKLDEQVKQRLVEKGGNDEAKLKSRIDEWKKMCQKLKEDNWIGYNGMDKTNTICQLIEAKIYNS